MEKEREVDAEGRAEEDQHHTCRSREVRRHRRLPGGPLTAHRAVRVRGPRKSAGEKEMQEDPKLKQSREWENDFMERMRLRDDVGREKEREQNDIKSADSVVHDRDPLCRRQLPVRRRSQGACGIWRTPRTGGGGRNNAASGWPGSAVRRYRDRRAMLMISRVRAWVGRCVRRGCGRGGDAEGSVRLIRGWWTETRRSWTPSRVQGVSRAGS